MLLFETNHFVDQLVQGGWEDDETVLEAASREAMEEAGVKGILRVSSSSFALPSSSVITLKNSSRALCIHSYRHSSNASLTFSYAFIHKLLIS